MNGLSRTILVLADNVTATGAQPEQGMLGRGIELSAIQVTVTGTGAVSATVYIEVSNDRVGWIRDTEAGIVVSGTTNASTGITLNVPWQFIRANVTAITGTNAQIKVTLGG